jgi:DNA-binding CsgD family transcriptional regulator
MRPREIADLLGRRPSTITAHIHNLYAKFDLREDGARCRIVQLALVIHEQRAELGVRCLACGEM